MPDLRIKNFLVLISHAAILSRRLIRASTPSTFVILSACPRQIRQCLELCFCWLFVTLLAYLSYSLIFRQLLPYIFCVFTAYSVTRLRRNIRCEANISEYEANIYCFPSKQISGFYMQMNKNLKGVWHEIFYLSFFHESVSPGPLSNPLGRLRNTA